MDGTTLYCIRNELSGYLPMKVQKIQQPVSSLLVFSLWNRSCRSRLVLSLEGGLPFFGFSRERRQNPKVPSGFCLGLRKRLEGGSLTAIRQESLDRVLYLDFTGHDDFGNSAPYMVVFDMAGKGSNIGLYGDVSGRQDSCLGGSLGAYAEKGNAENGHAGAIPGDRDLGVPHYRDQNIQDCRLITTAMPADGNRFSVGAPYKPPEGTRLDITDPAALSVVEEALKNPKGSAIKALISTIQGMGRDLALSVLTQAGADPDVPIFAESAGAIARSLAKLADDLREGRCRPAIYETIRGDVFMHSLPLAHLQPMQTFSGVLEAAESFRALSLEKADEEAMRSYASSLYRKVQKKLESRLSAQWEDLSRAEDADKYRVWGELINSSGTSVGPGVSEIEALDYYRDPPAPIVIPLDPRYSSRDNARNYFAKYTKAGRAKKVLEKSTHELRYQLERLKMVGEPATLRFERMRHAIDILENLANEAGVKVRAKRRRRSRAALPQGRSSVETGHRGRGFGDDLETRYRAGASISSGGDIDVGSGNRSGAALPRSIQALPGPDGSTIYVGGSAKSNDYLVSKVRRPGDVWFHAKGTKGAHVLLRPPHGTEPSDEMMLFAARIAGEKSQASGATKVEVDLVDAMRVKKPRGGAPGFVTYTGQKTVVVSLT